MEKENIDPSTGLISPTLQKNVTCKRRALADITITAVPLRLVQTSPIKKRKDTAINKKLATMAPKHAALPLSLLRSCR